MPRPLRILYVAGPGNVIGTYNHWVKGEDDPAQVSVTYSSLISESSFDVGLFLAVTEL